MRASGEARLSTLFPLLPPRFGGSDPKKRPDPSLARRRPADVRRGGGLDLEHDQLGPAPDVVGRLAVAGLRLCGDRHESPVDEPERRVDATIAGAAAEVANRKLARGRREAKRP